MRTEHVELSFAVAEPDGGAVSRPIIRRRRALALTRRQAASWADLSAPHLRHIGLLAATAPAPLARPWTPAPHALLCGRACALQWQQFPMSEELG